MPGLATYLGYYGPLTRLAGLNAPQNTGVAVYQVINGVLAMIVIDDETGQYLIDDETGNYIYEQVNL